MITEEQYRKLKADVATAKTEADRAQGALDALMGRLKEEYDCKTLEEARTLLKKLTTKRDRAQEAFEAEMKDYEERWKTEVST